MLWELGNERSFDISISVIIDIGQIIFEGELGQIIFEDYLGNYKNSFKLLVILEGKEMLSKVLEIEVVDQLDVVQRSYMVFYFDIINFLLVDCRIRFYGSRYSESNFSVDD